MYAPPPPPPSMRTAPPPPPGGGGSPSRRSNQQPPQPRQQPPPQQTHQQPPLQQPPHQQHRSQQHINNHYSTATAATTMGGTLQGLHSLADEAIAKRRAELRRLQANRGTAGMGGVGGRSAGMGGIGGGALANARSKLGSYPTSAKTAAASTSSSAAASALSSAMQQHQQQQHHSSSVATATPLVARRLDASYGTPSFVGNKLQQQQQQQQYSNNNQQQQQQQPRPPANQYGSSSIRESPTTPLKSPAFTMGQQQPKSPASNSAANTRGVTTSAAPKSPFGNARATISPAMGNMGMGMGGGGIGGFVPPPLTVEPTTSTSSTSSTAGSNNKSAIPPPMGIGGIGRRTSEVGGKGGGARKNSKPLTPMKNFEEEEPTTKKEIAKKEKDTAAAAAAAAAMGNKKTMAAATNAPPSTREKKTNHGEIAAATATNNSGKYTNNHANSPPQGAVMETELSPSGEITPVTSNAKTTVAVGNTGLGGVTAGSVGSVGATGGVAGGVAGGAGGTATISPSAAAAANSMSLLREAAKISSLHQLQKQTNETDNDNDENDNNSSSGGGNENGNVPPQSLQLKNVLVGQGNNDKTSSSNISKSKDSSSSNSLSPTTSKNLSRLMKDLQRTEKEKEEALEQVSKLKQLLEGMNGATTASGGGGGGGAANGGDGSKHSKGSLLDQFKEMITSKGEKAAVEWITKQLEQRDISNDNHNKTTIAGLRGRGRDNHNNILSGIPTLGTANNNISNSNSSGGMGGGHLLSSIVPPLTPRSRPGSRAGSPERGGGLSLSQTLLSGLGGSGGMGGLGDGRDGKTPRGKRVMTPMPKTKSMNSLGSGVGSSGGSGRGVGGVGGFGRGGETTVHGDGGKEEYYLVMAARSIPNEYGSHLATYFVRRPYVVMEDADISYNGGADDGVDGDGYNFGNNNNNSKIGSTKNGNSNMWSTYPHFSPVEHYLRNAHVDNPASIEVLAYIEADGSIFTLTGKSNVRHGKMPSIDVGGSFCEDDEELDWAVFDDVEEMERALGCVSYIDVQGNDREYWLDSIYEEALTTRESYCMSLSSAAVALKATGSPNMMNGPMHYKPPLQSSHAMSADPQFMHSDNQHKPIGNDANASLPPIVNNGDFAQQMHNTPLTFRQEEPKCGEPQFNGQKPIDPAILPNKPKLSQPVVSSTSQPPNQKAKDSNQTELSTSKSKTKQPPKEETAPEEFEDASSALPTMIVSLFSLFFYLLGAVIRIPYLFVKNILKFFLFVVALRILWLFLADDNGAWEMGAGVDYEFNMPGIY